MIAGSEGHTHCVRRDQPDKAHRPRIDHRDGGEGCTGQENNGAPGFHVQANTARPQLTGGEHVERPRDTERQRQGDDRGDGAGPWVQGPAQISRQPEDHPAQLS